MNALLETFTTKAAAVSAEVHHLPTRSAALDFIVELCQRENICDSPKSYGVWVDGSFLNGVNKQELSQKVPGLRFDVTRETAAAAKIGISQIDLAISDTGTLVQNAAAVNDRLASSLPAIHVALVPTSGIQPNMATALKKLHPRLCKYISMITGPSRTADIERVLTIGVHGPGRLIVVFVDELGESNGR